MSANVLRLSADGLRTSFIHLSLLIWFCARRQLPCLPINTTNNDAMYYGKFLVLIFYSSFPQPSGRKHHIWYILKSNNIHILMHKIFVLVEMHPKHLILKYINNSPRLILLLRAWLYENTNLDSKCNILPPAIYYDLDWKCKLCNDSIQKFAFDTNKREQMVRKLYRYNTTSASLQSACNHWMCS